MWEACYVAGSDATGGSSQNEDSTSSRDEGAFPPKYTLSSTSETATETFIEGGKTSGDPSVTLGYESQEGFARGGEVRAYCLIAGTPLPWVS